MATKKIPRGKARAPKGVRPKDEFTIEDLKIQLQETKGAIAQLQSLDENQFFLHPYFGNMKLKSAIKFLGIHSNHHLNIVNDIVNN